MNDFDQKWQTCVAQARQAAAREEAAPFGFATRVLACGRQPSEPSPETVWERFALGSLAGALALLTICAALEMPHLRDARPLEPGIENTVAQIVWLL